jgi:hypothetical protein
MRGSLAERYNKLHKDPQKSFGAYRLEFPYNLDNLF